MRRSLTLGTVAVLGLAAVAASQAPADKPLMDKGRRYKCVMATKLEREVEPVEAARGNWVRCKYSGDGRPATVVWLNLNQVAYFEPVGD